MATRLKFCLSMIEPSSIPHDPIFKPMHKIIHIEEKLFYTMKNMVNYYLLSNEEEPLRTCKNKNFIAKVMFLVAIARPRFDGEGNATFSGKIGEFLLVTQEPTKRNSTDKLVRTIVTKPITSVMKDVSRQFLIEKVLPAIKEKWPREFSSETIYIQQDNAPCHIDENDEKFCQVASEGGFGIRLFCQPPNSPYLNVLDLIFFSAIQALQHKEALNSIEYLFQAVEKAFETYSPNESNGTFLTLQSCMMEIMKSKGSTKYKIPHIKKGMMEREGRLPIQLKCDEFIVQEALGYLSSIGA